jgi:peptide/nickel transport system substrate-binding protein
MGSGRVVALVACAALLACAQDPARRGGQVVIGVRGDVSSFNVYTARTAFEQEIADLLFPRLAREQDDFALGPPTFRPALARSWELSSDGSTLTFHLDPAARWSDGRPVTADDVVLSQRAAASAEVGWGGSDVKQEIAEISAPDPRTVVLRFAHRTPYQLMDAVEGNVLPASVYARVPLADWPKTAFTEASVTSGPFRLVRHEPGSLLELARDPDYAGAPLPHLDRVVFRVIPDETALVHELLTGGIDFVENVSEEAAHRLADRADVRLLRVPDLGYGFVCWNTARPLFADPRVRRALTLAIDRRAILEGLLPTSGRPSAGPILSFSWAHDPELTPLPYDPDAAKALLAAAGFRDTDGDGILERDGAKFSFELDTNQGSALRASIVEMIVAQLRRVGLEAVPRIFEFGASVARHERHEFDAFVGSWREATKVDLGSVFHSSACRSGYNYGCYADRELDGLIDQARLTVDASSARELWRRAERIVVRDQPFTFLFERDRVHAVRRRIGGVEPSPRGAFVRLEEWYVEPEGRGSP